MNAILIVTVFPKYLNSVLHSGSKTTTCVVLCLLLDYLPISF